MQVTVFHVGVLPQGIDYVKKVEEVELIDLRDLDRLERSLDGLVPDGQPYDSRLVRGLSSLGSKTLSAISRAWSDQLAAREAGIRSADGLPAALFESGGRKWLYREGNLIEGYR